MVSRSGDNKECSVLPITRLTTVRCSNPLSFGVREIYLFAIFLRGKLDYFQLFNLLAFTTDEANSITKFLGVKWWDPENIQLIQIFEIGDLSLYFCRYIKN